ncbi:hypothetical protein Hdeb2414_s0018g00539491 [Helianthus debilis subsp. tardiflorus]
MNKEERLTNHCIQIDDKNRGSDRGQKDGENGAAGSLANTAFAANKDPLQTFLFQYILNCSFRDLFHCSFSTQTNP